MDMFSVNLGGDTGLFTMDFTQGWNLFDQVGSSMGTSLANLNPAGVATPAAGAAGATAGAGSSANNLGVVGGISMGLSIGQAIGGMFAAYTQSKTSKYIAEKQAQIMRDNQAIGQLGAESAFRAGEAQIAQLTYEAGQRKARQRTGYAASGVALGSGSAAEVMASTDVMKELDKNTASMNALANAWGYRRQAMGYGGQAGAMSAIGNYYGDSAIGSAVGSLLEDGGDVASRWYRLKGN